MNLKEEGWGMMGVEEEEEGNDILQHITTMGYTKGRGGVVLLRGPLTSQGPFL